LPTPASMSGVPTPTASWATAPTPMPTTL